MIHNLSDRNSILNQFVAEIRDEKVQLDPLRFRRNLERVGEVLAYEISKTLTYKTREIRTPLGTAEVSVPTDTMVLATILRAGLPIHQGLLNFFDHAERRHSYNLIFLPVEFLGRVRSRATAAEAPAITTCLRRTTRRDGTCVGRGMTM